MRGVSHETKERILDLWAGGADGPKIQSLVSGVSRNNLEHVISQARHRGDTRAVRRIKNRRPVGAAFVPREYARDGLQPIHGASLRSPELGIDRVTRVIPNNSFVGQGAVPPYVSISLPRLRFLEAPSP